MLDFQKLGEITQGDIISYSGNFFIKNIFLDSRKPMASAGSVFFAVKGERHDGHRYIKELYQKGVKQFVVEKHALLNPADFPQANILQVNNSIQALQQVASYHRSLFQLPVIAITGSNGKTIVKEWLSQLLTKDFTIVKSPKSYNSQIGVPLSVWEINKSHNLGIFEAGISQPSEMEKLADILRPTYGVLTNIGTAHDSGFKDRKEKIREKLKLFKDCRMVFYNKDYSGVEEELQKYDCQKFSWSWNGNADMTVMKAGYTGSGTLLKITSPEGSFDLNVPFRDNASLENIIHCIAVLLYFKIDFAEVQNRVRSLQPIAMRLELKEAVNGSYIIDDTYNNDLAGLHMALDFLGQQKQRAKKTLILSDLLESGLEEQEMYKSISEVLKEKGVDRVIGIGPVILKNKNVFPSSATFYASTEDFINSIQEKTFEDELILVKGARVFQFEKIIRKLQNKVHGTVLEINLDALSSNLNYYRSRLKPDTKIMVMVKAFAYGSGSNEVASLLEFHRVDYLAVAYADEGVQLRQNGITTPIMVMNPSYQTLENIMHYNLEPEIYSLKIARELQEYMKKNNHPSCKIHLKIDSGMHRLGFEKEDLEGLIEWLKQNPQIEVASVFTHLAGADGAEFNDFSKEQVQRFEFMANCIEEVLGYKVIKHALNSAGIVRFPDFQFDMVRLGIGLYGVEANQMEQEKLQTVGTLKTIISQIKRVAPGESVGYSRKGKVEKATTIATIAIGYADGFDRRFSNGKGKVLINNKLCPVIGNVCMDMTMVDITGVNANEGDEVIVFGKDLPIYEIANEIGTISYEILTGVSERVKRVFYTE
ncbi:MAG TPA: bifunctional UDP-N-acetylmuramoyl-tripeptide:D-alanyl-D-alanine ligase/alanine racemase [Cytophagaceae bacterium]